MSEQREKMKNAEQLIRDQVIAFDISFKLDFWDGSAQSHLDKAKDELRKAGIIFRKAKYPE